MATTNIELDIENITGVSDANAQFLISGQKFVVASVPKNLLKWAATLTSASSHGGNTSQGINIVMPTATDSILDVSRNGFSASEVPYSMKGFIANTASLHLATDTYPKYYLDNAVTDKGVIVIVKPIPTDSETARVLYVDSTKIDDDCDLRNAVVFHASAQEFEKLSSSKITDWTDLGLPVAPAAPTLSSSSVSFSTSAPVYIKPALTAKAAFSAFTSGLSETDPGVISLIAVAPSTPSNPSISYSDASLGDPVLGAHDAVSSAQDSIAAAQDAITTAVDGYTGELNTTADTDASGDSSSAYTRPSITTSAGDSNLTLMTAGTIAADASQLDMDTWWETLGDYIEDQEDFELAGAQVQKISTYISAFQAEVQSATSAMQATIQDAQNATQASITNSRNDVSVLTAGISSKTSSSVAKMQASTNASVTKMQQSTSAAIAKMQQSTSAAVQKMSQSTTAAIQKMQQSTNVNIQNASKTLEASIQDYAMELQKYQADIGKYQADVAKEIQEYQQKLALYSAELNVSLQAWQKEESDKIDVFRANIEDSLNSFNDANAEYQAQLQISIQDAQLDSQDDAQKLQKYASQLQSYQAEVGEKAQKFTSTTQNATFYSNESKKYYDWALAEVNMYIQNNSKMINQTMAAKQSADQQQYRR